MATGSALFVHGLSKARGGWKQAGQWMASVGVPPVTATLATVLEFIGGLFLILGLLVPLVAGFFAVQFASIIMVKATKMKASFMGSGGKPSYEIDFVYLLLALVIFFLGSGVSSLDAVLGV